MSKFDTEKYLLETLNRISRSGSEYKVLYVNISKLKPKNRHPRFVKVMARLFDNVVLSANGSMSVLSNGDFVILGKNVTPKIAETAIDKLRRGLITDPIWTAHSSTEFTKLYEPNEFDVLVKNIESLASDGNAFGTEVYRNPIDAGQLDVIMEHLNNINIFEMVKHQSVLKIESANKFKPLFEEFFVAVKDLSKNFGSNIDLAGNKWLFLYLTEFLDKKTMASFMFSDIKNKSEKIGLNLNLSTIFLPEFENFLQYMDENGQKLIAEIQVMDIFNNMAAYFDAKELLHQKGHSILIDAASIEMLQVMNVEKVGADYIKIFWHPLMDEYASPAFNVRDVINKIGTEKFIVAKALDERAIRWGVTNGIRVFQGPYIDILEAAMIRAKCPEGKGCSINDCLKRRKLITGAFRNECKHKDVLEGKLS